MVTADENPDALVEGGTYPLVPNPTAPGTSDLFMRNATHIRVFTPRGHYTSFWYRDNRTAVWGIPLDAAGYPVNGAYDNGNAWACGTQNIVVSPPVPSSEETT